jgi:hypothetical protein
LCELPQSASNKSLLNCDWTPGPPRCSAGVWSLFHALDSLPWSVLQVGCTCTPLCSKTLHISSASEVVSSKLDVSQSKTHIACCQELCCDLTICFWHWCFLGLRLPRWVSHHIAPRMISLSHVLSDLSDACLALELP